MRDAVDRMSVHIERTAGPHGSFLAPKRMRGDDAPFLASDLTGNRLDQLTALPKR